MDDKAKKPNEKVRARATRLLKRAARKLAEIPDEYLDLALRRLGEQLNATKPMWDILKKEMMFIPDEKIRQDAAIMILAYKWGKPVERSITANVNADDFSKVLNKAREVIDRESLQKTVNCEEITTKRLNPPSESDNTIEV